jgi:integrative and conjugative element protein (TIGR02256 family)
MPVEYLMYGEAYPDLSIEHLISPAGQQTVRLISGQARQDFELLELRYLKDGDDTIADVIVVDCLNDQVPTRNPVGIKNRERLTLVFPVDKSQKPSVRALRKDFPITQHQNQVAGGEPACLCLYFESWTAVERTWTPQKHLRRVLWWLSETAKGTLHREDQPVEQLYFDTGIELILPPDIENACAKDDLVLKITIIESGPEASKFKVLIGRFVSKSHATQNNWPHYVPITISLPSVIHGGIERFPDTLGELEDQLLARGVSVYKHLCQEVRRLTPSEGLSRDPQGRLLLILNLPIRRTEGGTPEKIELRAFLIQSDFTAAGEALGLLYGHTGKYCAVQLLGTQLGNQSEPWRQLSIIPIDVKKQVTKDIAQKTSGVAAETADFSGILAGVGALGGVIADLWSREGWGTWTLIDPDHLKAHNIVRHIAKNRLVGTNKVEAVKLLLEANFFEGLSHIEAISDSVLNTDHPKIQAATNSADFLVDATTTLYVPRELSQSQSTPRSASVFLTPSGFGSVLLIEDSERKVRLESLEAQYYRAIINSEWGLNHLGGHLGHLSVGASCRDVSAIISFEMVQLHAATLARRVRIARDQSEPGIHIWQADPSTGGVQVHTVPVFTSLSLQCGAWRVLWDMGIQEKLGLLRTQHLPNETGGIILGYIDHKLKTLFMVDVLSSPPDSEASPSGFTRGISGLEAKLNDIAKRTANIVGYVGEWHSHPPHSSARPSSTDQQLIQTLATTLAQDGQPALMVIVGTGGISITVQEI